MSDSDCKKQETNEMSTKIVSVYCLQFLDRGTDWKNSGGYWVVSLSSESILGVQGGQGC